MHGSRMIWKASRNQNPTCSSGRPLKKMVQKRRRIERQGGFQSVGGGFEGLQGGAEGNAGGLGKGFGRFVFGGDAAAAGVGDLLDLIGAVGGLHGAEPAAAGDPVGKGSEMCSNGYEEGTR